MHIWEKPPNFIPRGVAIKPFFHENTAYFLSTSPVKHSNKHDDYEDKMQFVEPNGPMHAAAAS